MKLLLLFATAGSLLFSQSITGVVMDESGAAVPKATVRLEAASGSFRLTAVSGSDGRFSFDAPKAERLLLSVDAPGFEHHVREASPGEGLIQMVLSVNTLAQQLSVTDTGDLADLDDSARATSVVGRADLDRRLEFSTAEALREIPGVRITQSGGPGALTNIRIRGLRPQDTSILIDGMRVRDASGLQGDASPFTADLLTVGVSRLEVMRGSGSALYGSNAIGGVVNIVTDPGGGKFRGDVLTEGGGLGFLRSQLRLSGGAWKDRLQYSLGAAHLNVLEGVDGDDRVRNNTLHGSTQAQLTGRFRVSGRVSAMNSFAGVNAPPSLNFANIPASGIVPAILPGSGAGFTVTPAENDPDSRQTSWLTSARFAADHQLTSRTSYRVAYQLVDSRRDFPNGPGGPGYQPALGETSGFKGSIHTLQARLNRASAAHITTAGAEYERESFDNSGYSRNAPFPDDVFRVKTAQGSWAAFAEDRWSAWRNQLQVTLSGRVQMFRLREPVFSGDLAAYASGNMPSPPRSLTGDASVMYRPSGFQTKFRAHVGSAYRAASLYERFGSSYFGGMFYAYGDPRLSPERSIGGDAGIDQYFGARRVRVSATYFYTQLRSVIGFDFSGLINRTTDPFGRDSGYYSTNGGLARGVETETELALWRGFLIRGAYTHTRTLERNMAALGTMRTPRIYVHTFTAAASQTWRRLTLTGNFIGSPEYLGVISGRAVSWPGPRRLDLTAGYALRASERLRPELFFRVENLAGQTYYEDGYRTPGRWAVGGIRVGF